MDKVKEICEALKNETLEPAKREAENIIVQAKNQKDKIVAEAKSQAAKILEDARKTIEREQAASRSAMELAAKQAIESLKQKVEQEFFHRELAGLIDTKMSETSVVAKLIETVVNAIEKDGVEADLEAYIPKGLKVEEVNQALAQAILKRLGAGGVKLGEMEGGAQVKLVGQHMTLDISDEALRELLARYIRDDFRQLVFS